MRFARNAKREVSNPSSSVTVSKESSPSMKYQRPVTTPSCHAATGFANMSLLGRDLLVASVSDLAPIDMLQPVSAVVCSSESVLRKANENGTGPSTRFTRLEASRRFVALCCLSSLSARRRNFDP